MTDHPSTGGAGAADATVHELPLPTQSPTATSRSEGSWDTEDSGYSIGKFYTGTTTPSDRDTTTIRLNIPTSAWAEIDAIIQQKTVPAYQTKNMLVRDAIIHRLHWLMEEQKLGHLQDRVHVHLMLAEKERQFHELQAVHAFKERTKSVLTMAADTSDWAYLADVIEQTWEQVGSLREPHRSEMRELLNRYRGMLGAEGEG